MNLVFLVWHVPAAYDFALTHEHWHEFELICFLASSLAFWVVHRPAMANPEAMEQLAMVAAVPAFGGLGEHSALGLPRVL